MSGENRNDMRTPMGRVGGLGSARSGTTHFWHSRVTSVALVPLTIAFVVIVAMLIGRNHAAVVQILASPAVSILLILTSSALALFVLLHKNRGGGMSDLFGGGMSTTMGGTSVAERNLDRLTIIVGLLWLACVLGLLTLYRWFPDVGVLG